MAQILDQELLEVDTPGYGQRCLYYAALLSLGMPANEATTKDLKQKVHEKIATILHDMNSHLNRNDLKRALALTDPSKNLQASDEVCPALAAVLNVKIKMHEQNGHVYEIDPLESSSLAKKTIHIGHEPGHFYAYQFSEQGIGHQT